ncbi:uncharacterized protein DMENIID0001_054510 [Sergentomyia squamirostris]
MTRRKLKIGWSVCFVADGVDVRRCDLCCSYNHFRAKCGQTAKCCLRCGDHHEVKDCRSDCLCCINCKREAERTNQRIPTNHMATDRRCPMYQKAVKRLREKIDFI